VLSRIFEPERKAVTGQGILLSQDFVVYMHSIHNVILRVECYLDIRKIIFATYVINMEKKR
jgi:hypothetical protein